MAQIDEQLRFEEINDKELEMIKAGLVPKNTKKGKKLWKLSNVLL